MANIETLLRDVLVMLCHTNILANIRFYGTYLHVLDNELSDFSFQDQKSDRFSLGVQAEVWW